MVKQTNRTGNVLEFSVREESTSGSVTTGINLAYVIAMM